MAPSFSGIPDFIGLPATLSLDTELRRLIELRYSITRDLGSPDDFCKAAHPATSSRSRPVRRGWRPCLCPVLTRGTALELMLKLLLLRHGKNDKHIHGLVEL